MSAALALGLALSLAPLAASAAEAPAEDSIRESVLRLTAGDVVGAEAQAKAAVAAAPSSSRALQQLALAANAAFDFATAEDAATRALAAAPPTPAILCLRSEARAGRGDFAGALEDAERAGAINPGSGRAFLRRAIAEEGLGRPAAEALADFDRAAELDVRYASLRDEARTRLTPRPRGRGARAAALGVLAAAAAAWFWRRRRRADGAAPARRLGLPGTGVLAPREAARALAGAAASASGPEEALSLAESLYERLTGRPPFPPAEAVVARSLGRFAPPSTLVRGLPVGIDAFFARALHPEPERRFRSGEELAGAFRSLVDPAVD